VYCLALLGATTAWYYPIIILSVLSIVCVLGAKTTNWLRAFVTWDRSSNRTSKYIDRTTQIEISERDLSDSPRFEMLVKKPVDKKSRPLSNKRRFLTGSDFLDLNNEIPDSQNSQDLSSKSVKGNLSLLPKVTSVTTTAIIEDNERKDELWKEKLTLSPKPLLPSANSIDTNLRHIISLDESIFDDHQYEALMSNLERDARQLSARQKSPMQKIHRPFSFSHSPPQGQSILADDAVFISVEGSAPLDKEVLVPPLVANPGCRELPGSPLGPGTRAQVLMTLSGSQSEKHSEKRNAHAASFSSSRSDINDSKEAVLTATALSVGRQRGRARKQRTHRGPGSQLYN